MCADAALAARPDLAWIGGQARSEVQVPAVDLSICGRPVRRT